MFYYMIFFLFEKDNVQYLFLDSLFPIFFLENNLGLGSNSKMVEIWKKILKENLDFKIFWKIFQLQF